MTENEKDRQGERATRTDSGSDEEVSSSDAGSIEGDRRPLRDIEEQLEEAQREKDQFRALLQRAQADFVNYRKRMQTEQEAARRNAIRPLILRILEGMDSFDAALDAELIRDVDDRWVQGMRAIRRTFEAILTDAGVERFDAEGQAFDPRFHDALIRTETMSAAPDTVLHVIRPGYKLGDDVLRPALVQVAVPPEKNWASPPTE